MAAYRSHLVGLNAVTEANYWSDCQSALHAVASPSTYTDIYWSTQSPFQLLSAP